MADRIPTFHAIEWFQIASRGWVCSTTLDRERDEDGLRELARSEVLIDGQPYRCKGVERFAHGEPWRAGESIGLLIEGEPPTRRQP